MFTKRKQKVLRLPPGTRYMSDADIESLIRLGVLVQTDNGLKISKEYENGNIKECCKF
jgi:hypothetical protein